MARLIRVLLFTASLITTLITSLSAWSNSMDWQGLYRFEFLQIGDANLNSQGGSKSYGLHHLTLRPHMIAADGIEFYGRFNLINNLEYTSSAVGGFFGHGLGTSPSVDSHNSNVLSQNMLAGQLNISELYLTWAQKNAILVVGRAPIHFGLGMMFNSGRGDFDHWFDTRDLIAYKMISGNMTYVPMLAKVNEGAVGADDDVTDYIFNVNYNSEASGLKMGLFYQNRVASTSGNDVPKDSLGSDSSSSQVLNQGWKSEDINIFVEREYENSRFAVELGLQKGSTGVESSGQSVELEGLGISTEWDYQLPGSRFAWQLKSGYASGDDPSTEDYEGYIFDKNYDVAMMLFNHPLGQLDVFNTSLDRNSSKASSARIDDQALSNVLYFSPRVTWKWTDKISLRGAFTYGRLLKEFKSGASASLDLGYELDLALVAKPYKNFQWVTELGYFIPGDSFKGGTGDNFDVNSTYGIITKAAISF